MQISVIKTSFLNNNDKWYVKPYSLKGIFYPGRYNHSMCKVNINPAEIIFGFDGKLYVSNWRYGHPAIGGGQVLQISFKCDDIRGDK